MEDNSIKYEVISKATQECTPVDGLTFGDGYIEATTAIGVIRFENPNKDGNNENEEYFMREIGTHAQPDGTGTVEVVDGEVKEVEGGAVVADEATA